MKTLVKYPRTVHIEGSGIQKGDSDSDVVAFHEIAGKYLVVEEKIDGANTGISFDETGTLQLQCRGHYLLGHNDWPEFNLFKAWGTTWQDQLFDVLEDRYIMYGEWMLAFHSVFYDRLPHFFMEFDIYDKKTGNFLGTETRKEMTDAMEVPISSVRILAASNSFGIKKDLLDLIGRSAFISDGAFDIIEQEMKDKKLPEEMQANLLKLNDAIMEGLYIKWEENGIVKGRYKYVRPNFVQTILNSDVHWSDRPTIPNRLSAGCDIFARKETK